MAYSCTHLHAETPQWPAQLDTLILQLQTSTASMMSAPAHCLESVIAAQRQAATLQHVADLARLAGAKQQVAAGASVNGVDEAGEPFLCAAVAMGDAEFARLLLGKGAQTNVPNSQQYDRTAMHAAAKGDSAGMVLLLLQYGAELNDQDAFGYTPLHVALSEGNSTDMIKLLLAWGADPNILTHFGDTALELAEFVGYVPDIKILQEYTGPYWSPGVLRQPLAATTA